MSLTAAGTLRLRTFTQASQDLGAPSALHCLHVAYNLHANSQYYLFQAVLRWCRVSRQIVAIVSAAIDRTLSALHFQPLATPSLHRGSLICQTSMCALREQYM